MRQFISLVNEGEHERALALCHPDVHAIVRTAPGDSLHGVDELGDFLRDVVGERPLYEVTIADVRSLDERRVIVEGRIRWMEDDHVLRDDPAVWALELEDGLLRRSTAVRTVTEAEALLAAASNEA